MENRFLVNPEIDQFNSMVDFIQNNYSRNISIKDLAKSGGVCRSKCFSLFNRFADKTPKDYLNDFRLNLSADYLCSSRTGISQISSDCGFSSQSYFSKLFLKKYGLSPVSFRKKSTGKDYLECQKDIYEAVSILAYYFYKILKVDLKNDRYTVIKPDSEDLDQKIDKNNVLSNWIKNFIGSSKIHNDDLKLFNNIANLDYARKFFLSSSNDSPKFIRIRYRRLVKGVYKWVLMEVLPAKNFSKDNQIVYLYIKNLDEQTSENIS